MSLGPFAGKEAVMNYKRSMLAGLLAACCLLSGCAANVVPSGEPENDMENEPVYIDQVELEEVELDLEMEMVPMSESPAALPTILAPVASGKSVSSSGGAEIDYSNITDGYVMVRFPGTSSSRLKVRVYGPTTEYTYDLSTGAWTTFPLSDGNGSYKVTVFQNTSGNKYATLASASFSVTLKDEFAPFLRPNQYVDYEDAVNTIALAAELTEGIDDPLQKVGVVYDYVVKNLTYDKALANKISSGQITSYLPDLDSVLEAKKGICFDYAALMTGMLRSQGMPCKLVVGYAGKAYHAWVSVWTEENGWVDGVIYFDGTTWQRMDPTYASSGSSSASIMKYIGNGKNYTTKYLY